MFCVEVISDQCEPLKMFSFWDNSENGRGVPKKVIFMEDQKFVRSLNEKSTLKTWEFFPLDPVFTGKNLFHQRILWFNDESE